jgi:hypothetical protein
LGEVVPGIFPPNTTAAAAAAAAVSRDTSADVPRSSAR